MRFCYNCRWITAGSARFCNRCGRSFDAKLCPRLHVNPREAQVCSECGSRDLTTPHPKPPLWLVCVSVLPGIVLLLLSLAFLTLYIYVLFARPALQFRFMLLGLVLGLLWLLYMELPSLVRRRLAGRSGAASKRDE